MATGRDKKKGAGGDTAPKQKQSQVVRGSGRKVRRAASWARGQARKDERRRTQQAATERNRELRANGQHTPHEAKEHKRREKRRLAHMAAPCNRRPDQGCYWCARKPRALNVTRLIVEVIEEPS